MPNPVPADAEALVAWFLKQHPSLVPLHGGRAGVRLPGTYPAIRVARVGGLPEHAWEDSPVIQVECWADDQGTASTLARTALAALGDVIGSYAQGSVRGHEITLGPIWSPDETTGRARYLFDVRLLTYSP